MGQGAEDQGATLKDARKGKGTSMLRVTFSSKRGRQRLSLGGPFGMKKMYLFKTV